jgi:hypothetical protein
MAAADRLRTRELPRPRATVGGVAAVLAVLPLLLIAVAPHLPAGKAVKYFQNETYIAVSPPAPAASVDAQGSVTLAWHRPATAGVHVWFRVMRSAAAPISCAATGGTPDCSLLDDLQGQAVQPLEIRATTRDLRFAEKPGKGAWWYSVGMLANWLDDPTKGDVLLLLKPVRIDVP